MEESKSILSSSEDKRPPDLVSSGFSASDQALIARDEFKASLYFAAIGVGYLFPFSALTQPVDYWHMLFPQFDVDLDITACYMWVNLIALGLIVFCASSEPNYSVRIVSGFVGQLIILVVVPSSYFWHMEEDLNYWVVMGCTTVAALVTALIDSCAISLAAQYPAMCQEYLQLGIGLSTLIGSIYRLFTKAAFPPDMVVPSSLLYFYSGSATVLGCILAYVFLMRMEISRLCFVAGNKDDSTHELEAGAIQQRVRSRCGSARSVDSDGLERRNSPGLGFRQDMSPCRASSRSRSSSAGGKRGSLGESTPLLNSANPSSSPSSSSSSSSSSSALDTPMPEDLPVDRQQVLRKVAFNQCMVFLLFASTLVLWPPLVTEIKSFNFPILNETSWWPLLLLFDFALCDVIGRLLVPHRCGITKDNIWIPVLARICILFPLILCSVRGVIFTHDFWSVLFVGLLGLTNGYVGSLSVVLVNEVVDVHERGIAGMYSGFVLNAGLMVGATLALYADKLVTST